MSRKIIAILIGLLAVNMLFSLYSDDFPIGTYCVPSNFPNEEATIASYMQAAKINIVLDQELSHDCVDIFGNHQIDVIQNCNSKIARAAKCNNWRYEAEYYKYSYEGYDYNQPYNGQSIHSDVILPNEWPEEMWYYAMKRDFDENVIVKDYFADLDSDNLIICEETIGEGFVLDELQYHSIPTNHPDYQSYWQHKDHSYPQISKSYYSQIGNFDYHISFRMRIPADHTYPSSTTPVCKVGLKILCYANNEYYYDYMRFQQYPNEDLVTLTLDDFETNLANQEFYDFSGFSVRMSDIGNFPNIYYKWGVIHYAHCK